MEIISDIFKNKELIEKSINKYGHEAEHHFYCYLYNLEKGRHHVVFKFNDAMILGFHNPEKKEWAIFAGILAPENKQTEYLMQFLEYVFSKDADKVWVEFETKFREKVLEELKKNKKFKARAIAYSLTWPVFDMKKWDGYLMQGKDWKDMRYYWNKFFKEHKVEFTTADKITKDCLLNLLDEWKKQRTTGDRAYCDYYFHAISSGFEGYTNTRVMIVDGKVCALTAGFKMTNRNYYYSSIGLYNRDFDRIGEIANMDDLIELKKKNYEFVDFGGGEESLTNFKKKFKPTYYYQTHVFSIVMNKDKEKK